MTMLPRTNNMEYEDTILLEDLGPPIIEISDDDADDAREDFVDQRKDKANSVIRLIEPMNIHDKQNESNKSNSPLENRKAYKNKLKTNIEQECVTLAAIALERPFSCHGSSFGSSSTSSFITPPSSPSSQVVPPIDLKDIKDPNLFEVSSVESALNSKAQEALSGTPSAMVIIPERVESRIDWQLLERANNFFAETTPPHMTEDNAVLQDFHRTLTASTSRKLSTCEVINDSVKEDPTRNHLLLSFCEEDSRHFSSPDLPDVPPPPSSPRTIINSTLLTLLSRQAVNTQHNRKSETLSLGKYDTPTPSTSGVSQYTKSSFVLPTNAISQTENLKTAEDLKEQSPSALEIAVASPSPKSSEQESRTPQISSLHSAKTLSIPSTSTAFASHIPQEFQCMYQKLSPHRQIFLDQLFMRRDTIMKILSKYQFDRTDKRNIATNEIINEMIVMSEVLESNAQNNKENDKEKTLDGTNIDSLRREHKNITKRKGKKSVQFKHNVDVIEVDPGNCICDSSQQSHKVVASTNSMNVHNNNNAASPQSKKTKLDNSSEGGTNSGESGTNISSTSCVNNMVDQSKHIKPCGSLKNNKQGYLKRNSDGSSPKTNFDKHSEVRANNEQNRNTVLSTSHTNNVVRSKLTKSTVITKHKKRSGSINLNPTPPKCTKQNGLTHLNTTTNFESNPQPHNSTSTPQHEDSSNKISVSDTRNYEVIFPPNGTTLNLKLKSPATPNIWLTDIKNLQRPQNQEHTPNNIMNNNYQNNTTSTTNNTQPNGYHNLYPNPSQTSNVPRGSRDTRDLPAKNNAIKANDIQSKPDRRSKDKLLNYYSSFYNNALNMPGPSRATFNFSSFVFDTAPVANPLPPRSSRPGTRRDLSPQLLTPHNLTWIFD